MLDLNAMRQIMSDLNRLTFQYSIQLEGDKLCTAVFALSISAGLKEITIIVKKSIRYPTYPRSLGKPRFSYNFVIMYLTHLDLHHAWVIAQIYSVR